MNTRPATQQPKFLEIAVAVHIALFAIGVSWAFGGNADWVRTPVSLWGSVGIVLALAIVATHQRRRRVLTDAVSWIWPIVGLNVLVAASCLTPGFRQVSAGDQALMVPVFVHWWAPSAARPDLALRSLWIFDGIYFSSLNIALAVSDRRTIRIILAAIAGNALILAVFGIAQKLAGSTGLYFGAVKSPQDYFFSTFVYDNHWGAFVVLCLGACIGLVLRYSHGSRGEGFFRGPAFTGMVAAGVLFSSIPLSGSRACTLLSCCMFAMALFHGAPRISDALRSSGVPRSGVFVGIAAAVALAAAGTWVLAGDVIQSRAAKTRDQAASMWSDKGLGTRSILYRDTLRMAREKVLFGWGMGSYPVVFGLYNSIEPNADRLPVIYHDAHSDWLQSAAENGLVGTALLGAAALLPALSLRRRRVTPIPYFLLCGCVLIAAYAWIEFPFGNVAVTLYWWLCFFGAVQYVRLSRPPGAGESRL